MSCEHIQHEQYPLRTAVVWGRRAQSGLVRWCALLSKCAQLEAVLDSTRRGRYLVKLLLERDTVERSRYASGYLSCYAFRGFSD